MRVSPQSEVSQSIRATFEQPFTLVNCAQLKLLDAMYVWRVGNGSVKVLPGRTSATAALRALLSSVPWVVRLVIMLLGWQVRQDKTAVQTELRYLLRTQLPVGNEMRDHAPTVPEES